jgi:teichuronic acid biosynthesis glycosyltransferase TuaC
MNKDLKVLIVCSGNAGYISPFIKEQADFLKKLGVNIDFSLIKGKGWLGYLMNYPALLKKLRSFQPLLIHAHYGFSGGLAVLQRKVPVIVTFHGSDINDRGFERLISMLVIRLSKYNIFVSTKLAKSAGVKKKYSIISCGVDMDYAVQLDKNVCRKKLGLALNDKYVLFSSSFDEPVKNIKLAQLAIGKLNNVNLLELKGYTREEVNLLMNACDLILVTSFNESGPLVVKEAVACGCPVVSTNVGDVEEVIGDIEGCYVTGFSPDEIAEKIKLILNSGKRIGRRDKIYHLELDAETVAKKILNIYTNLLDNKCAASAE